MTEQLRSRKIEHSGESWKIQPTDLFCSADNTTLPSVHIICDTTDQEFALIATKVRNSKFLKPKVQQADIFEVKSDVYGNKANLDVIPLQVRFAALEMFSDICADHRIELKRDKLFKTLCLSTANTTFNKMESISASSPQPEATNMQLDETINRILNGETPTPCAEREAMEARADRVAHYALADKALDEALASGSVDQEAIASRLETLKQQPASAQERVRQSRESATNNEVQR